MCVGSFNLEQNRDLEKHYSMLQGVGNFGFKQDHNATWRSIWNNKTCYKNATKLENFLSESFCFKFFFYLLAFSSFSCFFLLLNYLFIYYLLMFCVFSTFSLCFFTFVPFWHFFFLMMSFILVLVFSIYVFLKKKILLVCSFFFYIYIIFLNFNFLTNKNLETFIY